MDFVGHASIPVSNFPLALCAPAVPHHPQKAKHFESTPNSLAESLYLKDFHSPAVYSSCTGAGHNSPVYYLTHHGQVPVRKKFGFLSGFLTRSKASCIQNPLALEEHAAIWLNYGT